MIKQPATISQEARAVEALAQLRDKKINQFVVVSVCRACSSIRKVLSATP